jgi:phage terminase Nu1 subunit (DNA packaging protein)
MKKTVILNVRGIPEQLRRQFRALCVSRAETFKDALIRLMQQELDRAAKEVGQ